MYHSIEDFETDDYSQKTQFPQSFSVQTTFQQAARSPSGHTTLVGIPFSFIMILENVQRRFVVSGTIMPLVI